MDVRQMRMIADMYLRIVRFDSRDFRRNLPSHDRNGLRNREAYSTCHVQEQEEVRDQGHCQLQSIDADKPDRRLDDTHLEDNF
jgi:hypothetical protein